MAEYINKQDVMNMFYPRPTNIHFVKPLSALIREKIETIPAADVRPVVRARWNTVKYPLYECSNCGAVYQDVGYGFNFCPNCGADMRCERKGTSDDQ